MPTLRDILGSVQDAEIQRLLTLNLSPEELATVDTYYRAKWTTATRKAHKASGGYFAGPDESFPLKDCGDVPDAWGLAGHAANPDQVRSNVKRWASAHGCSASLPDTAKDGDRTAESVIIRADGNHDPFKGKHTHAHPAYGAQGEDGSHEHLHMHAMDADHNHSHAGADIEKGGAERATLPAIAHMFAPIHRIDKEKREVEGVATSEEVDSFGTVFSYEGSKRAFQQWMERTANVREMHDKKAVGKGIILRFDDPNKKIYVRSTISRGANDTWLKVEDGVLSGYSVGAIKPTWGTIERGGKEYPYLLSYELAELSLVDNASNPDAQGLVIARAAELTELVDITDPEPTTPTQEALERAGARISASTRDQLHSTIKSLQSTCGCADCQAAMGGKSDGDGEDRMVAVIERALASVVQRQQSILARFAQLPETTSNISIETLQVAIERVMQASHQDKTYELLSTMQGQIERIAAQPQVGLAPILNGSRPVEKSLATDVRRNQPANAPDNAMVMRNLQALQAQGGLDTQDLQQAAARLMLQMQQGR